MVALTVKKGLSSPAVTSIPQDWDRQWFRYFIDNFLSNADIRNVTAGSGITISGNVSGNSTSGTASTTVTIAQSPIANNTVMGNVSGSIAIPVALSQAQLTALVNVFTPTLSGAVPVSGGGTLTFLRADGGFSAVSLAALSSQANNTVVGNVGGVLASPIALSQAQLTTLINTFTSTLSGAVPASGGGITTFLRADSTFSVPPTFTSGAAGYVPASGGGTVNFLRADGTFAVPTTSTGANPTAAVGLSAVNGAATTFLRSDGAPALNQAISPTWSGNHVFTPSSGVAVTVNGTTGNSALTANGAANSVTISAISANSSTAAFADLVIKRAGSTANAFSQGPALKIEDTSGSDFSTTIQSSGGQTEIWSGLGASQTQILKILTTGGMTLKTPTSGPTLSLEMGLGSFSATANPAITLVNSSAGAQTPIDFFSNTSTLTGRIRNDSSGNMTLVSLLSGTLDFFVGGDFGVGTLSFRVKSGKIDLENHATTTTAPAAGGAGALPATPKGYVTIQILGADQKLAYY